MAKHSTEDDCWIAIGGKVYDLTGVLKWHPGGSEAISVLAGKNGTVFFNMAHIPEYLDNYKVMGLYPNKNKNKKNSNK